MKKIAIIATSGLILASADKTSMKTQHKEELVNWNGLMNDGGQLLQNGAATVGDAVNVWNDLGGGDELYVKKVLKAHQDELDGLGLIGDGAALLQNGAATIGDAVNVWNDLTSNELYARLKAAEAYKAAKNAHKDELVNWGGLMQNGGQLIQDGAATVGDAVNVWNDLGGGDMYAKKAPKTHQDELGLFTDGAALIQNGAATIGDAVNVWNDLTSNELYARLKAVEAYKIAKKAHKDELVNWGGLMQNGGQLLQDGAATVGDAVNVWNDLGGGDMYAKKAPKTHQDELGLFTDGVGLIQNGAATIGDAVNVWNDLTSNELYARLKAAEAYKAAKNAHKDELVNWGGLMQNGGQLIQDGAATVGDAVNVWNDLGGGDMYAKKAAKAHQDELDGLGLIGDGASLINDGAATIGDIGNIINDLTTNKAAPKRNLRRHN